jgi:DNA invertase Pin-like site-specific DNA recombinase
MNAPVKIARVYLRVSTDQQDLERQEQIVSDAKAKGFYVAGVYREKASGARSDRPELLRMIRPARGEVVSPERRDRISDCSGRSRSSDRHDQGQGCPIGGARRGSICPSWRRRQMASPRWY